MANELVVEVADREIRMSRTFSAPREVVWEAFTVEEHLVQWWGPPEFPVGYSEHDFREGGSWYFELHGPDGMKSCNLCRFDVIEPPSRLVVQNQFVDEQRQSLAPAVGITMTFDEVGASATAFEMRSRFDSNEARDQQLAMGVAKGFGETFDRLAEHLAAHAR
ncbi:MAG: SRPBCC domain-containing protein [Dehalococcoidia bacterium]|nr:SRPBCC domain-containing protein [Dehalococcoidia bacterium]